MESGAEIRRLRQAQGLPIPVVAARAACSPATLLYWEKWQVAPKTRAIRERIAAVLGVDLASIESEAQGVRT